MLVHRLEPLGATRSRSPTSRSTSPPYDRILDSRMTKNLVEGGRDARGLALRSDPIPTVSHRDLPDGFEQKIKAAISSTSRTSPRPTRQARPAH